MRMLQTAPSRPSRFANVAPKALLVLAVALSGAALSGCVKAADNDPAPAVNATTTEVAPRDNGSDQEGVTDMDVDTSTALVVYAHDDEVAFVNQDTGALYLPTLPEALYGIDGQKIDEDQLAVGNIVSVTGNGVMLESYPGQYPGISKIQVISQGNPADAAKYAAEVETIFQGADPAQVPTASLEYTTDLASVGLPLTAYEYEWNGSKGGAEAVTTSTSQAIEAGEYHAENGTLREDLPDARISAAVQATLTLSSDVTSIEVERTPIAQNDQGAWALVPGADDGKVPVVMKDAAQAELAIEPGYVYEIEAAFGGDNETKYAFYAIS